MGAAAVRGADLVVSPATTRAPRTRPRSWTRWSQGARGADRPTPCIVEPDRRDGDRGGGRRRARPATRSSSRARGTSRARRSPARSRPFDDRVEVTGGAGRCGLWRARRDRAAGWPRSPCSTGGTLRGADPATVVTGPVVVDSRAVRPGGAVRGRRGGAGRRPRLRGRAPSTAERRRGARARARPDVPTVVVRRRRRPRSAGSRRRSSASSPDHGGRPHRLLRQDQHQGPVAARARAGGPRRSRRRARFNNELGLPLTVLLADPATRLLVLEMGARGVGHIALPVRDRAARRRRWCSTSASPTSASSAPGSTIARGQGRAGRGAGRRRRRRAERRRPARRGDGRRTAARVVTFGQSPGADVRSPSTSSSTPRPARVRLSRAGRRPRHGQRCSCVGAHQSANALAAAAAALRCGLSRRQRRRRAVERASRGSRVADGGHRAPDGVTVVNDAYNANPESMRAALQALVALAARVAGTWAVLGEMRELGARRRAEHRAVGADRAPSWT